MLSQKKPEALVVLAYFAVQLHRCTGFWIVGGAGRFLLGAVGRYLGEEWGGWLEWPRGVVYAED
jgi:hypothetical protein